MFLRSKRRFKDGKAARYFSGVENRRVRSERGVQRQVLFLGEINDRQEAGWRETLEVFDEAEQRARTLSLFPEDREIPADALDGVQVKLAEMELRRARAFGFMPIHLHKESEEVTRQTFTFHLDKEKLKKAGLGDGHYLLGSNLVGEDPPVLWERYVHLTQIEAAFKTLKSELGLRPIYHQLEKRLEAHLFVAFLAYALSVTLKQRLEALAPGLTPRAVLEKLATIQMLDVCFPTADGRWLIMPRYTQPEPDQQLMLHRLELTLPSQPPPRIKAQEASRTVPPRLQM
jgi:hypothetical protein